MANNLYEQASLTVAEIIEKASLGKGDILVVGCSTSEIIGSTIGTNSAPEIAKEVFEAFFRIPQKIFFCLILQVRFLPLFSKPLLLFLL